MEYHVRTREKVRLMLTGIAFYTLGMIWLQRLTPNPQTGLDALSILLNVFFCMYGAYGLSKALLSRLEADDRGLLIKEGLKPKARVQYADIGLAVFDKLTMRMIFQFENGRRFSFEYIFDDINGFLSRLTQNGIDVQKVRSTSAS